MPPQNASLQRRQGNGKGPRIPAVVSSVSSIVNGSDGPSDSGTRTGPSGTPTSTNTRTRSISSTSATDSSSATDTDSSSDAVTDTASTTTTTSASRTSLSSTNPPSSATHSITPSAIVAPPTTNNPTPTTSSSVSSSPFTSVLVRTTATVDGHLTTFSTLVPTTLSAFPPSSEAVLKPPALAGTIIGTLLVAALLAVLASLFYRKRKERRKQAQMVRTRRSQRRVLDDGDGDDDVLPMRYTGSAGGSLTSSSHEGPYRYGVVGSVVPPSPGPAGVFGPPPVPGDAFAGKDPATIRQLKASRAGSASGSVFREDFGDADARGSAHTASPAPSMAGRNFSHDRFSTHSSSVAGLLYNEGARAGSTDVIDSPVKRTTSPPPLPPPTSFHYPPAHDPRLPFISTSTSQFSLTQSQPSHQAHSPKSNSLPPGAAVALGPNKRNSLIVDEQFGLGGSPQDVLISSSPMTYVSPQTAGSSPHQYHYRKRKSSDRPSLPRSSFTLPDMPVRGDGNLTDPETGSRVDLRPYMSSDDEEGPAASSRRRPG